MIDTNVKTIVEQQRFHQKIQDELANYTEGKVNKSKPIPDSYLLVNDVWDLDVITKIEDFMEYEKKKLKSKSLYFLAHNFSINLELKYIFYKKLFSQGWSLTNIFGGQRALLKKLAQFLNEAYPEMDSLLKLDLEKAEKRWVWWLNENNIKTTRKVNRKVCGESIVYTAEAKFLKIIHSLIFQLADSRDEWEKDRWDVRVLNQMYGIEFSQSVHKYYINFFKIENTHLRGEIKKYFKHCLLGRRFSWGTAMTYMEYIPRFINFVCKLESEWHDLTKLSREHMLKYIEQIHYHANTKLTRRDSHSEHYVRTILVIIRNFLEDLQTYEYSIAPMKSARTLIFSEDIPKLRKKSYDHVDYIPDYVLEQLFQKINYLHPEIQPFIWIAFKTGLRISDTLTLTQDCLVKLNGKYQIVTDIKKTYVQGHSIPIDDELALNVLVALIDKSKKNSNERNNPNRYIFVRYSGPRRGRPYSQNWVREQLNIFAKEQEIRDENGNLFHFRPHQFRHTYAVKMLNGGADILTVQELLAHASPGMTMCYARLLDDTKRKAFESVMKQGVFSFDLNGEVQQVQPNDDIPTDILEALWRDHKLNAIDNPYGTCYARVNGNCPHAEEPPCLTCNGGSPCKDLAVGFSELDVQKYELHLKTTTRMIQVLEERGRHDTAEKNRTNLKRYEDILNTIKQGNIIFGRLERTKRKAGM
ncbi:transposase [Bacillus toyonensis]|uniref:tyrosine-type recombinase/integrase n=1 Tax=Bacillus toyonensis TaxID=155322 RepID=UPI000BF019EB|nr:tyrosine-type recombinase/integrase [Bacillus toyonensis]PEN31708.1 transposase [Bacillus toyonensis]PEO01288.1 transposase [Bacillus toyonensis]